MSDQLNTLLSSWGNNETPKEKKVLSKVVEKKTKKKKPEPETMDLTVFADEPDDDEDIPIDEQIKIEARRKKAEMISKEQKAIQDKMTTAVMRGQLLRRDLFYDYIVPFIDGLLGDIQRTAGSFLSDISKDIVDKGELSPDIIGKWTDKILEIQDDSKLEIMKRLEEIEKEQAEK